MARDDLKSAGATPALLSLSLSPFVVCWFTAQGFKLELSSAASICCSYLQLYLLFLQSSCSSTLLCSSFCDLLAVSPCCSRQLQYTPQHQPQFQHQHQHRHHQGIVGYCEFWKTHSSRVVSTNQRTWFQGLRWRPQSRLQLACFRRQEACGSSEQMSRKRQQFHPTHPTVN